MKILFVACEVAPFVKVGGMGDVVGSLPKALAALGHDVRIMAPRLHSTPIPGDAIQHWWAWGHDQPFSCYETTLPGTPTVPLYWLDNPSITRDSMYGYRDDAERFILFCRGAIDLWARLGWTPDVYHCHDWHTAIIPWLSYSLGNHHTKSIVTIHNLAYQGWCDRGILDRVGMHGWGFPPSNPVLLLPLGCWWAQAISVVSPTYAQEIQTPLYGEKLDAFMRSEQYKLHGILNGIDTETYNPATDKDIPVQYEAKTAAKGKAANKKALLERCGWSSSEEDDRPLFTMVTRLVEQKGLDLLLPILDTWLTFGTGKFFLLGTGDPHYEFQLQAIASRNPGRFYFYKGYSADLAQLAYAGGDILLMPSHFEPCGLSQIIALRYGCIPLVRFTGGLKDTVTYHNPADETGTGYGFDWYESTSLLTTIFKAEEGYRHKDSWNKLVQRAMAQDFSWEKSAKEYEALYEKVTHAF
jgi:starch synthase